MAGIYPQSDQCYIQSAGHTSSSAPSSGPTHSLDRQHAGYLRPGQHRHASRLLRAIGATSPTPLPLLIDRAVVSFYCHKKERTESDDCGPSCVTLVIAHMLGDRLEAWGRTAIAR